MSGAAPAVIRATFSDYRTVKGRKVLQIVMEVPLEQQASVFGALGYPVPDRDIWCAIARLVDEKPIPIRSNDAAAGPRAGEAVAASPRGGEAHSTRSEIGKQRYALASDMEKALVRAAKLPDDVRFRRWAIPSIEGGRIRAEAKEYAIQFIRDTCCAGKSRKLIAEDRDCYEAFLRMETSYLIETGVLAEPR